MQVHGSLSNFCTPLRFIFEKLVLEGEVRFNALAPAGVMVKIDIGAALIVGGCQPRLLVTLEPCKVLGVVPPRQLFQLLRCKVLLVGALLVIEDEEERVQIILLKHRMIVVVAIWLCRICSIVPGVHVDIWISWQIFTIPPAIGSQRQIVI